MHPAHCKPPIVTGLQILSPLKSPRWSRCAQAAGLGGDSPMHAACTQECLPDSVPAHCPVFHLPVTLQEHVKLLSDLCHSALTEVYVCHAAHAGCVCARTLALPGCPLQAVQAPRAAGTPGCRERCADPAVQPAAPCRAFPCRAEPSRGGDRKSVV